MAPTEILAAQHYEGIRNLCDNLEISIELLTGSTGKKEKERIYAGLADGTISIVVGTHALIQEGVQFSKLGLIVIDEQHRFGVEQRARLQKKGGISSCIDYDRYTYTSYNDTVRIWRLSRIFNQRNAAGGA
nr:DEAD/DEAH box helicase [Veillonella denticariosi]